MLLESRIDPQTRLFIDADTAGGFAKDEAGNEFHPDDALKNVVELAAGIARKVSEAARHSGDGPVPADMRIDFGVKVQGDALVCLAKTPEDGQFRVSVSYRP